MPRTNVRQLGKDGTTARKRSYYLHRQIAPILSGDETTGLLARATAE
jgi:hypothetical protein